MERPDVLGQTGSPRDRSTAIVDVVVIGAGVIGLTTALELADADLDVVVHTAEPSSRTTSAVAAAVWYPYLVGPADAVERWGRVTADELARLAADPTVPVQARTLHEYLRTSPAEPLWRAAMPDVRPAEDVPDWATGGWSYTTWTVDMPPYLGWLHDRLDALGVEVVQRRHDDLGSPRRDDRVRLVVDCAGIGAADLVDDPDLTPVRGQVVLVEAPEVTDVWLDPDGPEGATYVIPRGDTVVCGGTAETGAWDRTPDDDVSAAVLRRAAALVPALADAPVVGVAVGLRPSRPAVRLEVVDTDEGPVLHHYGHGGAGVTLSWGSAREAAALARATVERA